RAVLCRSLHASPAQPGGSAVVPLPGGRGHARRHPAEGAARPDRNARRGQRPGWDRSPRRRLITRGPRPCDPEDVLDVELPETSGSPVVGSFRACLSSVLELAVDSVPQPDGDLQASVSQWRTWLAGRGFGLVPIAHASTFQWPGYWIAVLEGTLGPDE